MVSLVERTGCKNMTDKKINCGCLFPFIPCLYQLNSDELARRQRSNEIDKQLAKEKEIYLRTHRLLLLGAGESGKSTILKQMQLIHVDDFSDSVRKERRRDIRNNVLDAILSMLKAMPKIKPPVELDSPENEQMAEWIIENATKPDFNFPQIFYEYTEELWNDSGVQATFERSNEYQLIDSAKYFLDKINIISKDDYLPTDQDILRCRVITTGIYELLFQVNNVKFRMIDVGGQRGERRKWFLCFNDVTAIIFVTSCSSFDLVLREDETKNRLRESLDLFRIVWNNRWLGHISVILFLNKQDLFRDKILSGRSKLEDYFPEYRDFQFKPDEYPNNDQYLNEDEHPEVLRGKYFIRHEFEKITLTGKQYIGHRFYPHFTCAIDTENIKRVFDDCRDSIQRKYLLEYDLI